MTCVTCKTGIYQNGFTNVILTKGDSIIIIKQVPAEVCNQCGDYILSSDTSIQIQKMAKEAFENGSEVEIRRFAA